jgi:hypothetical protein
MGVEKRNGWFTFRCDVDGVCRDEPAGINWDENRLAFARAKEQGWWLSKQRGKWVALCSSCARSQQKAMASATTIGQKFNFPIGRARR